MIYVCDAIMGSGKSSAAIELMNSHPEKRFLYVTPYNSEADRIEHACAAIGMRQPEELDQFRTSKVVHTAWFIEQGLNVASTHQAFIRYDLNFLKAIREKHYTLIIDENISPLQRVTTNRSYISAAKQAGFIDEIMPGVYTLHDKENRGEFDERLFYIMQSHDLILIDSDKKDNAYYWIMPPDFLLSFDDVYILTYLFEGQGLYSMLRMYDIPFTYIGIEHDDASGVFTFSPTGTYVPDYTRDMSSALTLVDNAKLNADGKDFFAYSKSSYSSGKLDRKAARNHLKNFFTNMYPCDSQCRMWSTFKDFRDDLKGNGYASMFRALNLRATNEEAQSRVLAYMVNLFVPRVYSILARQRGEQLNDGLYALSTMVQWIWRSAIRNGQPIILYLPSRRMRDLLTDWIDDLEHGRDPKERFLEGATDDE